MSINLLAKTFATGLAVAFAVSTAPQFASAQSSHRYPASQQFVNASQGQIPVANPIQTAPDQYFAERSVVQAGGNPNNQAVGSGVAPASFNQPANRQQVAQPVYRQNPLRGNASLVTHPTATPGSRVVPTGYVPRHLRTAQLVSDVPMTENPVQSPVASAAPVYMDEGVAYEGDMSLGESYVDSCGGCGSCDSCVTDCCGLGCDRGGCPPELIGNCWINAFGDILYRADYFAGAACWDSPVFSNSQNSDYNGGSGFYAGANIGIPLCRLTCGLASGQIGLRTVQSEISGSPHIDQLFITAGLFRRVDYGLQFGVVADYLQENVLFDATVMQLRGDLSWVYAGGNAFGVRVARGIQDDQVPDFPAGVAIPPGAQMRLQTLDSYRAYYRTNCDTGGYSDCFFGWTDDSQFVGGMDLDMPLTNCMMLQAGATYVLPTSSGGTALGGNTHDAWNVFMGFVFRPQGRCWYQNYDRPIMPVADNGSMVLRRGF